jgi:hypothetical protein
LFDAAVATGSVAIPAKLPEPVVGTEAQAAPNGSLAIMASLPLGALLAAAADAVGAVVAAVVGAFDAPLDEHAPTNVAARRRPAKAPVRLRLLTVLS